LVTQTVAIGRAGGEVVGSIKATVFAWEKAVARHIGVVVRQAYSV
jgi:hypothetical protein